MSFNENFIKIIREDFKFTRKGHCRVVVFIFRMRSYLHQHFKIQLLRQLFKFLWNIVYFLYVMMICHCEFSKEAVIGPGLGIYHAYNILVGKCIIGKRATLGHEVTVTSGEQEGVDRITVVGDDVMFSMGCRVVGPINIGSNVNVGANAVLFHDVADNMVVLNQVIERPRKQVRASE